MGKAGEATLNPDNNRSKDSLLQLHYFRTSDSRKLSHFAAVVEQAGAVQADLQQNKPSTMTLQNSQPKQEPKLLLRNFVTLEKEASREESNDGFVESSFFCDNLQLQQQQQQTVFLLFHCRKHPLNCSQPLRQQGSAM